MQTQSSLSGERNDASLSGVETIFGSAGDDNLTITTNDIQSISGGDGFDAVTLSDAEGSTVNLDNVEFVSGGLGDDDLTITTNDIQSVRAVKVLMLLR